MKKYVSTFLVCFLGVYQIQAQIIDVLQVSVGTAFFPETESLNFVSGKPENIYGAYKPAQTLGFGASKFLTSKWQLLANAEVMNTFKSNYNLVSQKTALNIKYNILAPDIFRLSPYIIGGGSLSLIYLSQSGFTREYVTPADYDGVRNVDIQRITYNEDSYKFFSPAGGANIGVGLDVNVFEIISVFGELSYNRIFTTSSGLQDEYNKYNKGFENKADLIYTSLNFGLRVYMY